MLYEMLDTFMVPVTDVVDIVTIPAGLYLGFRAYLVYMGLVDRIFSW
jgi:hypothetical protein